MWQLTELITGLPGLLALCIFGKRWNFVFSLLKESLLFLKSKGFDFFMVFISDIVFSVFNSVGSKSSIYYIHNKKTFFSSEQFKIYIYIYIHTYIIYIYYIYKSIIYIYLSIYLSIYLYVYLYIYMYIYIYKIIIYIYIIYNIYIYI